MLVGPVVLTRCREVISRIRLKGACSIDVSEINELAPILRSEPRARCRHWSVVGHRPIAGEHSFAQEHFRIELRRKLEVTVLVAGGDAAIEHRGKILNVDYFYRSLDLVSSRQPQPRVDYRAK